MRIHFDSDAAPDSTGACVVAGEMRSADDCVQGKNMADNISVNSAALAGWAAKLSDVSEALSRAESLLRTVDTSEEWWSKVRLNGSLRLRDSGESLPLGTATQAVSLLSGALDRYQQRLERLSEAVKEAASRFEDAEASVCSMIDGAGTGRAEGAGEGGMISGGYVGGVAGEAPEGTDWWDFLCKLATTGVAAFGAEGKILSKSIQYGAKMISGDATGGDLLKYLAECAKPVADWVKLDEKYAAWVSHSQAAADKLYTHELLGLRKYAKGIDVKAGWASFGSNLKKSFADKVGKASTWVVSGIVSGVNNDQEYSSGAISADRAVVEGVFETVGSVVTSALTTAAVGAAITAATGAAPAAAVVLVVSGAITVGADFIWKSATGSETGIIESAGSWIGERYEGMDE